MNPKYVENGKQAEWMKKYRGKFKYVNLRLTAEDHALLKEAAKNADMSINSYILSLIHSAKS